LLPDAPLFSNVNACARNSAMTSAVAKTSRVSKTRFISVSLLAIQLTELDQENRVINGQKQIECRFWLYATIMQRPSNVPKDRPYRNG
jgi:hypothetical protein